VQFVMEHAVDAREFQKLTKDANAIVIAAGKGASGVGDWGLPMTQKGLEADPETYRIGNTSLFAVGSAFKPARMAIRALGQGKEVAFSVDQFLNGEDVRGEHVLFNSRFGKLMLEEFEEYLKESVPGKRIEPSGDHKDQKGSQAGFSEEEVKAEAARCLHCDCRDLENCKLRIYSDRYKASQKMFSSVERKRVRKHIQHDAVIYEPTKCIKCGICVRLTSVHKEKYGMSFIGRGFDVEVNVPFNESLKKGLEKVALEVADACPTGAISRKS